MGISWALDVPHINWKTVNVFQLLCWVQDLTWSESGEGHPRAGGIRVGSLEPKCCRDQFLVLEDKSNILRTCLTVFLHAFISI